ncbi:hypothetical protein BU26DRAFT_561518 [Trematosphaeria pertusa]|uniref:F-box domain-containing protein n=1 Tax=Trematosphaeria pertusa TaxID=390896 RepID=A0A6A6IQ38_9PLEO|nr:uncharacterized protein BU26DRAFT_561518 [Trematosphaeria pertusa]KAF2251710.1 hypothetical protein BU26DRAFT_561518 [Trematosphaeria pertusa]
MTILEDLPDELLLKIAGSTRWNEDRPMSGVCNLALVSRRFRNIAQESLYRSPYIADSYKYRQCRVLQFLRTILDRRDLLAKVKEVFVVVRHREVPLPKGADFMAVKEECICLLGLKADIDFEGIRLNYEPALVGLMLHILPPLDELEIYIKTRKGVVDLDVAGLLFGTYRFKSLTAVRGLSRLRKLSLWSGPFHGDWLRIPSLRKVKLGSGCRPMSGTYQGINSTVSEVVLHVNTQVLLLPSSYTQLGELLEAFSCPETLSLSVDNAPMAYDVNGHPRSLEILGTSPGMFGDCQLLVDALGKVSHSLRQLQVVAEHVDWRATEWLDLIAPASSLTHFPQLKNLTVHQEFLLDRFTWTELPYLSISEILPGSLAYLDIINPTASIRGFLGQVPPIAPSHFPSLKNIQLSADDDRGCSFLWFWRDNHPVWKSLEEIGILVAVRHVSRLREKQYYDQLNSQDGTNYQLEDPGKELKDDFQDKAVIGVVDFLNAL